MSVNFNTNNVIQDKKAPVLKSRDNTNAIKENTIQVSENNTETLNISKKSGSKHKVSTNFEFVEKSPFIKSSSEKIKNLISNKTLTDENETQINKILSSAAQKNKLNQLLENLKNEKIGDSNVLETLVLKWDSHLPVPDESFFTLFKEMLSGSNNKVKEPPQNNASLENMFNTIFTDKNLNYSNGKNVVASLNKRYTGNENAIGENIQNDFLFLILEKKPENLSKSTLKLAQEVLSEEGFKPDHLERVFVGKKILNNYLKR